MSTYSEKWQAAKAARRARRAADPKVQARVRARAAEGDRQAAREEARLDRGRSVADVAAEAGR